MHPKKPEEPVIAPAVGAGTAARDPSRAKRIEAAMAAAIMDALAEGIPLDDSETIRARMMAARKAATHVELTTAELAARQFRADVDEANRLEGNA